MIDLFQVYEELSPSLGEESARVLTKTLSRIYEDVRQTVTKAEFRELTAIVRDLATAQKELAAAQKELAAAQKRTEEALLLLTKRVDRLEERVEGISHSVGYVLENSAYRGLPALLARHGIEVRGRLVRRYLGEYQVNILGQGVRAGAPVTIVGECKVRPSRKEVDRFLKVVARLEHEGLVHAPVAVFVGHDFHPAVERYLEDKGVLWFWSYELEPGIAP